MRGENGRQHRQKQGKNKIGRKKEGRQGLVVSFNKQGLGVTMVTWQRDDVITSKRMLCVMVILGGLHKAVVPHQAKQGASKCIIFGNQFIAFFFSAEIKMIKKIILTTLVFVVS